MRFIIILSLIVTSILAYGQTSSISSASHQSESLSLKTSWSVGDLLPEEFISSSLVATPGVDATALFIVTGDIDSPESITRVYPIPFNKELFIETSSEDLTLAQIMIMDASGRVLDSQIEELTSEKAKVNTVSLTPGAYFLYLKTPSETKTFKLLKK